MKSLLLLLSISITLTTTLFFVLPISAIEEDDNKTEGYDIIKEKVLPKCLEYQKADMLDYLKNQDTELYLMCMDFILDDLK